MKSTAGEKKYDLLFIGNSRRVYRQIVQDALTLDYNTETHEHSSTQHIDTNRNPL